MDSIGLDGLSARGGTGEQLEESSLGDHDAAPETDHGQLPSGDKLVGEGPGEPEERAGFGHAEHQPVVGQLEGNGMVIV
jgi:hypothetical protein